MINQISILNINYLKEVINLIRNNSNLKWSDKQIKECFFERSIVYGLFNNEKLIAVSIFSYIFDEAELLYVITNKNFRGKSIAKKLLIKSIESLKEKAIKTIFLEVNIKNTFAIKLYEKLNFKQISIRKNYYKNENNSFNDAAIYQLNIF